MAMATHGSFPGQYTSLVGASVYVNRKELGIITETMMNRSDMDTTYKITGDSHVPITQEDLDGHVYLADGKVIGTVTRYELMGGNRVEIIVRSGPQMPNFQSAHPAPWTTYGPMDTSAWADTLQPIGGSSAIPAKPAMNSTANYTFYDSVPEDERMDKLERRLESLERYCLMLEVAIKQAGIDLPMNLMEDEEGES